MRVMPVLVVSVLALFQPGCVRLVNNGGGDDLETVLAELRERADDPGCLASYLAECNSADVVFTYDVEIDAGFARFFDATTGEHLGTSIRSVFGSTISFVQLNCRRGTVTEAICGAIEVGDEVSP